MRGTRLYFDLGLKAFDGITDLFDADGFVIGGGVIEPPDQDSKHIWILRSVTPLDRPAWTERNARWVCDDGLEQTARLRDGWPSLRWVPCADVYCPSVHYDFFAAAPGDGFSVYRPDTATMQRYTIANTEDDLHAWLAHAKTLGFRSVWLHGRDAAEQGRGFDLELLDRARRSFGGGHLWLSGGATEPKHLANLMAEGGAAAIVLPKTIADQYGCGSLLAALGRAAPETDMAVHDASASPNAQVLVS